MIHPLPDALRARACVAAALRRFFAERDFVEVDTPVLLRAPAPERFIDAPAVELVAGMDGQNEERRYLQASPELSMKLLLAAGLPRIYQLAPAFRDGDWSPKHCPEFRLLEWYRAHADWIAGMADCEALVRCCLRALEGGGLLASPPRWAQLLLGGEPIARMRFADAIAEFAGVTLPEPPQAAALHAAMRARGLHAEATDSFDELCHRMWAGQVEPGLAAQGRAVFITHFPAPMAGFAALCASEPSVCERFELCVGELELCNGFTELRSRIELEQRFECEVQARRALGKTIYPRPDAYFHALPNMPPAVGVALGFERLLMALLSKSRLDEVCFVRFADV